MNFRKYFTPKGTETEICKQSEASTSIPSTNSFKLSVTNADYNVNKELVCQSHLSEILEDTRTPLTPTMNLSDPALWPKICNRKF
jgi:hypothetical protein